MSKNCFAALNAINVNDHTEKKNGLTYLSWAWAWAEVMKIYPGSTYNIWKDENHRPYIYDEALGYMVFTDVTIEGDTKEMWLPVMDGANKAMKKEAYSYKVKNPNRKYARKQNDGRYIDGRGNEQPEYIEKVCEPATMFDINTAIMRCLVKNLAMFGLGLYIYAGEDLPEGASEPELKGDDAPWTPGVPVPRVAPQHYDPPAKPAAQTKKAGPTLTDADIKCIADIMQNVFTGHKLQYKVFERLTGYAATKAVMKQIPCSDFERVIQAINLTEEQAVEEIMKQEMIESEGATA